MTLASDGKTVGELLEMARELSDAGRDDEAIVKYKEAIELDPNRPDFYYDVGLIYKYRSDWRNSFDYNSKAYALDPEDEGARWNLAIAATALRDWATARRAWADNGITFNDEGDGPISGSFGRTPVRLNPDDSGEVVWGNRIDPVRLRIGNIPFPESGFRCGDVVLHDGAPMGTRKANGNEYPVFNVLELFEPSPLSTFCLEFEADSPEVGAALARAFDKAGLHVEEWALSVNVICRKCSEGVAHEHVAGEEPAAWSRRRRMGISAMNEGEILAVLDAWDGPALEGAALSCALEGIPG